MCRFLVYKGREMFMSDLLTKADQSLIMQSYHARERAEPLNGDGFGVGWYAPQIDPTPCVFTSTAPAWSNRNLYRLADKIGSSCFFAHVRAASPGAFVTEANCHPFQYEQFLFMHNGGIAEFGKIRRKLRELLSDETYNNIQGTTDSEHIFALFIDRLTAKFASYSSDDLCDALGETIEIVNKLSRDAGITRASRYNFCLTDGQTIVATKYITDHSLAPHSLYIAEGERFENQAGNYVMVPTQRRPKTVIIASEPLTGDRSYWKPVPDNHLVVVTPELHVKSRPLT